MGMAMPTYLEKAPTLVLMEQYFNGRYPGARPRKEILLDALAALRSSSKPGDWLGRTLPELWSNPAVAARIAAGDDPREFLKENWFGLPAKKGAQTTGFWIGYKGDVESIVRHALIWAIELCLGLPHGCEDEPDRLDPWLLELTWLCGFSWFESWVTVRPTEAVDPAPSADRGMVSVLFLSPTHRGSRVSTTQIAPDSLKRPATRGIPAHERQYATWVVMPENHEKELITGVSDDTTAAMDFGVLGLAQLSRYTAQGDTVVVSPSLPGGGTTYDGAMP
jgi:hypothetical protein